MTALKAHVRNGKIVVDEPIDLPEGAELNIYLYDVAADGVDAAQQAQRDAALERSAAEADAGQLVDTDVLLAELQG